MGDGPLPLYLFCFCCAPLGALSFFRVELCFCSPRGLARGCVLASVGSEAARVSSCMEPHDIKKREPQRLPYMNRA